MSKQVEKRTEELGSMCIILHRERSFHNIDTRILKSAIQKYARRAMFSPKGLWCLIELDLFSLIEIKPNLYPKCQITEKQIQQNALRMRSNMINRLVAMMSEDVGPCNSRLPSQIYRLYLQWIKTRREPSSRKTLLELYYFVANDKTQRIRLLSDLRTIYNLPEYLTENKHLHRKLLEKFEMTELIDVMYENQSKGKTKQQLCDLIIEHLKKKSELAFAYLSVLFQRNDQALINQRLWPYIIQKSPFPDSTKALAFFYKTLKHKEHYLYLYHAMAFIIYEDTIRQVDQKISFPDDINVDQLYKDHFNDKTVIELDSFVFDRHTGVETSRSDFAIEGAQVTNECKELFNEKYRKMYQEFKVMIDDEEEQAKLKKKTKRKNFDEGESTTRKLTKMNSTNETIDDNFDSEIIRLGYQLDVQLESFVTDELSKLAQGQCRTSVRKKAVFISSDYIYKGPYSSCIPGDRKRFFYNLYFTRALITLEEYLKIPDQFRSIVDWYSIVKITNTNDYYLKQKALGQLSTEENDHEIMTTKIESNVKVLRRGSHINRLNELEKEKSNFQDENKQILQACLQHMYLRYLLNIGDSGTWNILVRRDEVKGICGIDFEEIRTEKEKISNDPLTMIMSKVSKQQRDLYGKYTNGIVIFKEKIDLSSELAKTLSEKFQIHVENVNKRIEQYANCVSKKN
ncbi:unnamed protein product [Adineta ricciae]|uniref:Uncharacterized protein n=1 Tax=Adineta ricciae TaxID=249248 RepID=A0A814ZUP5_ADIRI|nr:unnamed protein product [Adineta ricciae]CAF1248671.1 unnamed protein product [Adineta ricciae]